MTADRELFRERRGDFPAALSAADPLSPDELPIPIFPLSESENQVL